MSYPAGLEEYCDNIFVRGLSLVRISTKPEENWKIVNNFCRKCSKLTDSDEHENSWKTKSQ
jgi:hypothetical protein